MNTLQAKYGSALCFLLLLLPFIAKSQITLYPVQDFNFGTFYTGNAGGTISISTEASRSSTGDILLLNSGLSVSQAIYEIEAPLNTMISIISSDAVLTNGKGETLSLEITEISPSSFFTHTAVSPDRSTVHFGAKLTIGGINTSPPGAYQGTVSITFNYE